MGCPTFTTSPSFTKRFSRMPASGAGHLAIHLVRGDLHDGLIGLHVVAFVLQPFDDGGLGHALAHLGQQDLDL